MSSSQYSLLSVMIMFPFLYEADIPYTNQASECKIIADKYTLEKISRIRSTGFGIFDSLLVG